MGGIKLDDQLKDCAAGQNGNSGNQGHKEIRQFLVGKLVKLGVSAVIRGGIIGDILLASLLDMEEGKEVDYNNGVYTGNDAHNWSGKEVCAQITGGQKVGEVGHTGSHKHDDRVDANDGNQRYIAGQVILFQHGEGQRGDDQRCHGNTGELKQQRQEHQDDNKVLLIGFPGYITRDGFSHAALIHDLSIDSYKAERQEIGLHIYHECAHKWTRDCGERSAWDHAADKQCAGKRYDDGVDTFHTEDKEHHKGYKQENCRYGYIVSHGSYLSSLKILGG